MVKFHAINRTITAGTVLFIVSLVVLAIGAVFHSNGTVLAYTFLYGGLAFLISLVVLAIGLILGAKSGKLQKRTSEIFGKSGKKQ
jgi:F0F1-type ATP synthase assembly protein I